MNGAEDRFEPTVPPAATEIFRRSQPTREDGAGGKNDERHRHHPRRFMDMSFPMFVGPAFAVKDHIELPEHVEGGDSGSDPCDEPESLRTMRAAVSLPQNKILRKEARGERHASDGKSSADIGPVGCR